MKLLDSERLIFQLDTGDGHLVLTTHRVSHTSALGFTTIMLEDVCSVAVTRMAHRWLLAIVGLSIAVASYLVWTVVWGSAPVPEDPYRRVASLLLFVSALLVIVFTVTRFSRIQVASPGACIEFRVRSRISREIRQFVRDMESAKNARYLEADRTPEPITYSDSRSSSLASLPDRRIRTVR